MSTPDPNDLRDPRFDAAWRSASHEEPPAALDDAIRAAARREVSAGPQSIRARTASTRSALSPQRWWAPLAAAATIGAIAVGVLQLSSPDKIVTPANDKAVVSDMPAPASSSVAPAPPSSTGAPVPGPSTTAPSIEPPRPVAAPSPAAPSPAAPAAKPAPAPPSLRKDASVPFPARQKAAADAESDVAKTMTERQRQVGALDAAKPASPAEPFPADAVKREAKEGAANTPEPAAVASPSANPDSSGFASGKLAAPPAPAVREEAKRDAARASTPVAQSLAPSAPAPMRRMQEAGATSNVAGGAVDARAKVTPKLAVPDWIALIRKLRDEGKTDDATKELATFRAAYPDHEELLPPDLRNWKPVVH